MSGWQEAYETGAFAITTDKPSDIVESYADLIPAGTRVADIGCGAGRNALYLASRGHNVEASDIVALDWTRNLELGKDVKINFIQRSAEDTHFTPNTLGAVLLMRLIQYLPFDQVGSLIHCVHEGLVDRGVLFVNYTSFGGIHDIESLDVPKFQHPFGRILDLVAQAGFDMVHTQEADMPPLHTNLVSDNIHACDLVAIKSTSSANP